MTNQTKVDYREIVGYLGQEYFGDKLHRVGEIINQQNSTALFARELMGLQKLASMAVRGRVEKAVSEIEKKTRSFDHAQFSNSFYDGSWDRALKKSSRGALDCSCYLDYIDICLFGARLAESAKKHSEALELYQRAYHVLRTKGNNGKFGIWLFSKYLPNIYAKEYQNREKMLRSGIKRIVKNSGAKVK